MASHFWCERIGCLQRRCPGDTQMFLCFTFFVGGFSYVPAWGAGADSFICALPGFKSATFRCEICNGQGTTTCRNCGGKTQLLSCIEAQVEWKSHVFEYAVNQRSGFPIELLQGINGKTLFVDEQNMVYPVTSFPENAINQVSRTAIELHQKQFAPATQILRQRQTIELVFLSKVEYEWNGKSYSYYVYGNEHKVYADDYPRKCCCFII